MVEEVYPSDISQEKDEADVLNMKWDSEGGPLAKKQKIDAKRDARMMSKPAARPQKTQNYVWWWQKEESEVKDKNR